MYCDECKATPCDWYTFGDRMLDLSECQFISREEEGKIIHFHCSGKEVKSSYIRRYLYTAYTHCKTGTFGAGDYQIIPMCVTNKIREMYSSEDGTYPNIKLKDIHNSNDIKIQM